MNVRKDVFSKNLEIAMNRNGYNQMDLSRATGISHRNIWAYVNERNIPGSPMLCKISKVLGVSMDSLMKGVVDD